MKEQLQCRIQGIEKYVNNTQYNCTASLYDSQIAKGIMQYTAIMFDTHEAYVQLESGTLVSDGTMLACNEYDAQKMYEYVTEQTGYILHVLQGLDNNNVDNTLLRLNDKYRQYTNNTNRHGD